MKYLMSFFLIDILAILPLPQVVIGMVMRGSKFLNAVNLLKYFVIFQSVPRAIRIYPLFTEVRGNSGIVAEATWPKAVFNLLLYMLAGHVLGALWYFFAIERLTVCWKKACVHHNACSHGSFYCDDNSGDYRFLNDFCPTKMQNTTIFNFGIFSDALQSGVVEVTDFPQKFLHCLQWGLQNLSCFGQNLQTSSYVWENFFAIFITISGLVLFLFLIGNIQIYLQSKTIRSEEMRLKLREIEQWMPYQKLSKDLQQEVRKHQQYIWRETKGVDVENFLNNLPKNLKRSINRELFLRFLLRVPIFDSMKNEQVLSAMCDRLKPVLYTAESYIVQEGDPVDEMLFIMRGKLLCATTDSKGKDLCNATYLVGGDFIGEEVFTWALNPGSAPDLPVSTRTVRALTEIEGFVLMVDDLKFAASQFRQQNKEKLRRIFRFYSLPWRTWAACFIQAAWRRYVRTKLKESLHEEIDRLQASSAKFG
ncbi:Cyclic nucleotide-gated ion channel 1 [Melia azedarach]|nr:Cyclic nucleotide-gated ion channel 1 [Melia azedarach]